MMFDAVEKLLYRCHILSSTHCSFKEHTENCNLQAAAFKELSEVREILKEFKKPVVAKNETGEEKH